MSAIAEIVPDFDAAFDALERGDLDTFTEITRIRAHPNVIFRSGIGSVVSGGSYEGIEGVSGWFADLIASTSERHWRDRRYEVRGDDMLVFLAQFEFTGAASGAPVASETGAVFEFEDGRCVRITSFMSFDQARRHAEAQVA